MATTISKALATSLAVRYEAYLSAYDLAFRGGLADDWRSVGVWAAMLLETQKQAGLKLIKPAVLLSAIERSRRFAEGGCR